MRIIRAPFAIRGAGDQPEAPPRVAFPAGRIDRRRGRLKLEPDARAGRGEGGAIGTGRIGAGRREETWLVCPVCDLLHRRPGLREGETARCRRCDAVIATRRSGAVDRMIAGSVGMILLMALAVTGPFLAIDQAGLTSSISLLDAAAALSGGWTAPLGLFVGIAIFVLPVARAAAHLYALAPGRLGLAPPRHAGTAMRWSTRARPWAMAEIFMVGVSVSLVKIAGLAHIEPGPAFWALGGAVAVLGFENAALCRETVWAAVEGRR